MSTLAIMRTAISEDVRETDINAAIDGAINASIKYYQQKRFWFNETRDASFATVEGQSIYGVADNALIPQFIKFDGLYITVNSSNIRQLRPIDLDHWEERQDVQANSEPYSYVYYQEALMLYPTPGAGTGSPYSVRMTGHISIPAPVDDVEENNVWMNEAFELIRARSNKIVESRTLRDFEQAAMWAGWEKEEYDKMVGETVRKTGTGLMKATWF